MLSKLIYLITLVFLCLSCKTNEEEIIYSEPKSLDFSDFTFIPVKPKSNTDTKLVFYDCSYYKTSSVMMLNKDIYIKKHFNGQLKWPCKIEYDSISLSTLHSGTYKVTLEIIDTNPFQKDSVFYSKTKVLVVSNP